MKTFLAVIAVLASALTFLIMVAFPWHLESKADAHAASSHEASRISEMATLQGDTLLAAACWPHTCPLPERR